MRQEKVIEIPKKATTRPIGTYQPPPGLVKCEREGRTCLLLSLSLFTAS